MSLRRTLAGIIAAMVFAACSAGGGASTASPVPTGQAPASAAAATVEAAGSPTFGMILTGANGMALYTSSGDSTDTSACTGSCATAWPPLSVPSGQQPTAGTGVTGRLTTFTRTDGTTQVAYDGLPLYYWQTDAKPGDVTGDGVNGFSVAKVAAGGGGVSPASPSGSGGRYGY